MKYFALISSLFFSFPLYAKSVEKLADIPSAVAKFCYDSSGRIADVGQPWEISDAGDGKLPRSILVGACKNSDTKWSILCRKGGFASSYHLVKVEKDKSGWKEVGRDQSPSPLELKCP